MVESRLKAGSEYWMELSLSFRYFFYFTSLAYLASLGYFTSFVSFTSLLSVLIFFLISSIFSSS